MKRPWNRKSSNSLKHNGLWTCHLNVPNYASNRKQYKAVAEEASLHLVHYIMIEDLHGGKPPWRKSTKPLARTTDKISAYNWWRYGTHRWISGILIKTFLACHSKMEFIKGICTVSVIIWQCNTSEFTQVTLHQWLYTSDFTNRLYESTLRMKEWI